MSALLEPTPAAPPEPPASDPTAVEPPEAAAPAPVERPCSTCGAALAEGQDWCLECGSAQPGRLGGRPGWRGALTVLGVTGVLALGAGAAAYAALDSEASREATAQAPPSATPTQQTPPPATASTPAPVPPPADDATPTDTVDPPKSEPADVPAPKGDADDSVASSDAGVGSSTPSTPAPSSTPSTPPATAGTGTDTGATDPQPVAIALDGKDLDVYDPYKRSANQAPGDVADAVDGKSDTAWSVLAGPDGQVRMGLVISLDKAQKLGDLKLKADTPGFTVETYATKSSDVPPDVLDARWKHLDDARDVGVRETLKLDGTFRHVLLWITAQPADTKVAIPEIELFQQED
jgi:hypothetical protein